MRPADGSHRRPEPRHYVPPCGVRFAHLSLGYPPARLFSFETARRAAQPAQACLRWGRRFAAPWKDSTSPKIIPTTTDIYPNTQTQSRKKKPPSPRSRPRRCANNAPLRLPVRRSAPREGGSSLVSRTPGQKTGRLLRATASRLVCQRQTSGFPGPPFGGCYGAAGPLSASRLRPNPSAPRSLRAQRSRHRQSAVSRPLLRAPFTRKKASRIFRRQPNEGGGCRSKNVLTGTVSQSEGRPL